MPRYEVGARLVGHKGGLFDTRTFRRDVARVNQKIAKRMKRSFGKTTQTWDHRPTFHQRTDTRTLTVEVFTVSPIYFWLDQGTSVRYATMTTDFVSKTRPGQLDSYPGSGGLAYVSLASQREGVEAREFAQQVEEAHGPDYEREIDDAVDRAARRGTT